MDILLFVPQNALKFPCHRAMNFFLITLLLHPLWALYRHSMVIFTGTSLSRLQIVNIVAFLRNEHPVPLLEKVTTASDPLKYGYLRKLSSSSNIASFFDFKSSIDTNDHPLDFSCLHKSKISFKLINHLCYS